MCVNGTGSPTSKRSPVSSCVYMELIQTCWGSLVVYIPHNFQSYPMSLDMWEEGMLLLLRVASHDPGHWEACVTVVSDAVRSLSSKLLHRNSNERTRVESTQATIHARCVLYVCSVWVDACLYVFIHQCIRMAVLSAEVLLDRNKNKTHELKQLCEVCI